MERLTEKHYLAEDHYMKCSEDCNVDMDCVDCPAFDKLIERLAAYEDTGLTPERCAEFARADAEGRYIVMRDAEQEGVARLRELAEADKDGRLVVLPVRPVLTQSCASMLYIVDDDEIYEDSLYEAVVGMSSSGRTNVIYTTLSDQMIFGQEAIGKTVFLTREEAEKALQEMEGKKDD